METTVEQMEIESIMATSKKPKGKPATTHKSSKVSARKPLIIRTKNPSTIKRRSK